MAAVTPRSASSTLDMLDHAGASLVYLDRDFNIVSVNGPFAVQNRRPPAELVGRCYFDLGSGPETRALFEKARADGAKVTRRDVPFRFPDEPPEATKYWDWVLTPILDERGEVAGFVGRGTDVTEKVELRERLLAEEKRRREEVERLLAERDAERALLDAVIEYLPVGIGIAEAPSGRLLRINEETRRIWRMSAMEADDASGYGKYVGFHPDGRPYAAEDWQLVRALHGEEIHGERVRFIRGDGTHGVMRSNAGPVRNRDGDVVAAIVTIDDVSEIVQAEQRLRDSEQRYATIFDRAPFAIALTRMPEGITMGVNDAFLGMFGVTREEVIGKTSVDLGISDPEAQAHVRAALRDGGMVRDLEVTRRTRSGALRILSISLDWVVIDGERQVLTAVQDVTVRRRAEQELLEAKEQLEEANRRKNEFLAMLSHELRNPLAPIRTSLYVLDQAAPGSDQARRAQAVIDRQVGHLTRLVDDLLDVMRVTRGKLQLQLESVDLGELALRTVEDHRSLFVRAEVDLEPLAAPGEVLVVGDRTRLAQAIGNLLQNAVKFTPGGGRTTVSVDKDLEQGRALLRVRDTGGGIAPQMLPHLFEPFTQADTTLDRSRGGLGLGLALVKGLVEMHGGTVRGESDGPGTGATFTISLPLDPTATRTPSTPRGARVSTSPRRVLVIEDNEDAADSLRVALELGGHSVEVATSGPEGIEMARASRPDVVLCDIGLPGMDGYGVARALRADPELGRTTLVALTGYARPGDVARATEVGFTAHLAKPPSLDDLLGLLEQLPAPAPSREG